MMRTDPEIASDEVDQGDMNMTKFCKTWTGVLAVAILAWPGAAMAQRDMPGPIDSLQDLQDMGKVIFKLADDNNDGQISQAEAIDAGNLLVGGFFFRSDANGDGAVSQEEATAAREAFLKERPWLRYIVETVRTTRAQSGQDKTNRPDSLRALVNAFDTNNDKQLQATELRQAVQTTVQGIFATGDTNRDGQLSPTEVNATLAGMAKSVAQAAFQQADADNNGSLSEDEFQKALSRPAHVIFAIMDLNHDGQITPEEAQRARRAALDQIKRLSVPEPANSPRNLIRSGRTPNEVAPVPTVRPVAPAPARAPQPAQPAAPTTPPARP